MERIIMLNKPCLYIPIKANAPEKCLEIYVEKEEGQEKIFELMIPVFEGEAESYECNYWAHFDVERLLNNRSLTNSLLILKGDVTKAFLDHIEIDYINSKAHKVPSLRPNIHFTAESGWINDPNGLVYADGIYHLYFQYNPFNTEWNNMSWGHAVSKDLLKWEQKETVLFPDKEGTMFSGCGIINERKCLGLPKDALIYFYTAAGNANKWSSGKQFTQRIAYSTDKGETLIKLKEPYVDTICKENRDPKVYWHDESNSYIMALWLEENIFAILRSENLENWQESCRFSLEGAWECPDLVKLYDENGNEQWMFWSADGFYFFGEFDGYTFKTDGIRHNAYFGKNEYAAQTYFGTEGRTISIPWLRFPNDGRIFTGAMGLPREISFKKLDNGELTLVQKPVKEFFEKAKFQGKLQQFDIIQNQALYIKSECDDRALKIDIGESILECIPQNGIIKINDEVIKLERKIDTLELLIDDTILEVWVNNGIITGAYNINTYADRNTGIRISSDSTMEVYTIS